ncbi:MAG: hypothetical protein MPW14_00540 [Candidatus Manganitrophus sp.]|nr:MAG: hypothetical protein MPW14_00540 [Candidatus Manganitrophus sp.]
MARSGLKPRPIFGLWPNIPAGIQEVAGISPPFKICGISFRSTAIEKACRTRGLLKGAF